MTHTVYAVLKYNMSVDLGLGLVVTRVTQASADISCRRVCLSVCPSVTSQRFSKTAKRIVQTTPHDSRRDSSSLLQKISAKLKRGHPQRRRQMQMR